MTGSHVVVSFRPHWVNGWWLHLLTRPFADVDGHEVSCSWDRETSVVVDPGTVGTATFIRYRGIATPLGVGRLRVAVAPGQVVHLVARNGLTNGAPFSPSVVATP